MVKEKLEPEVVNIIECMKSNENFLLTGGAGSGKTYSLVQIIKEITRLDPLSKIACITYTNAAAKEINDRILNGNVSASTIHDFLWDNISHFQKDMKESLLEIINDNNYKINNPNKDNEYYNEFEDGVSYKEYLRLDKGEISHDEVLILANYMYKKYSKLRNILKSKYKYIFVDEYQDTSPLVIEILLDFIQEGKLKTTVGLFGDLMQCIYDDGVGDVNNYIDKGIIKEIQKKQNRRCPQKVIELANKLRIDNLAQTPSNDLNAPNMKDGVIKQGDIKFIYSKEVLIDSVKECVACKSWDFKDPNKTKELYLTHKLIANKAGFEILMKIYDDDPIIKFKNEIIKEIKAKNIKINENDTFDSVVNQVDLRYKKEPNKGKTKLEVRIEESDEFKQLYELIKHWKFGKVKKIYFTKDNLIDGKKDSYLNGNENKSKRDQLISHLFKIQNVINLYNQNKYNEFLRITSYNIKTMEDKLKIKNVIDELNNIENKTIEDVINYAHINNIYKIDDRLDYFIVNNEYLYKRVKDIQYKIFKNLYDYLEGYVPISTQHKIKGTEFDNVLAVLDNGGWPSYNFEYLFDIEKKENIPKARKKNFDSILERTKKLFYVCCTRAKENLVVYYVQPSDQVLETAKEYFGEENIINLDKECTLATI
ncbi:AAA family ATPase [Paraclostridium bifermentans]|uniref:AAA family ATPase n=1 Tax=Paraclostridium bifermentans TaxID=1490 RepID=UPI00359C2D34